MPVHPRVCGERDVASRTTTDGNGSSPRVRGTLGEYRQKAVTQRFIPACAGNAYSVRHTTLPSSVHPRVCGERFIGHAGNGSASGSSPRVRGTRPPAHAGQLPQRFIPACAGNAGQCAAGITPRSVHPRVCGERIGAARTRREISGSSPRVRGTHRPINRRQVDGRFIPACAGNAQGRR